MTSTATDATDADLRPMFNRMLATQAESAPQRLAKVQDELTSALSLGYLLSDHLVGKVVAAQTEARLWAEVQTTAAGMGADAAAAAYVVGLDVQRELLRGGYAHRSTSTLSNAMEDVQREAKSDWLRGMGMSWVMGVAPQPETT